jgi:hypothetical protein
VTWILRNRAYCGQRLYAQAHTGKYHRVRATGPSRVPRREKGRRFADPAGAITPEVAPVLGAPIVPVARWAQAQQLLAARTGSRADDRSLPLVGLVVCGLCGRRMFSAKAKYRGTTYTYYSCRGRESESCAGPRDHAGVTVRAEEILEAVVGRMRADLFTPEAVDRIVAASEQALHGMAADRQAAAQAMAAQAAELAAQVETVRRNMLYAPTPELSAEFAAELTALRARQQALAVDVLAVRSLAGASASGAAARRRAIRAWLGKIEQGIAEVDGAAAGRAIRSLVSKITVLIQGRGKRRPWSAHIEYRPAAELCDLEGTTTSTPQKSRILIPALRGAICTRNRPACL